MILRVLSQVFSSVQSLSCVQLCNPMDCRMAGIPVHHQLLEFTQTHVIESMMPSNHLILCCPLLLPPSIIPSIRVFSKESVLCIRWPNYWGFSFNISPSNEHSGLISFRMDWLYLLAVQGTLTSLLQYHSSKASILRCSAFFIVQLIYACESWAVKKAERRRIDAFELWCWRRLLRVPWTAGRSNQSILKEISPGCSLEGLMLKLKPQYFGHLMCRTDLLEKTLMLGRIEGRGRR